MADAIIKVYGFVEGPLPAQITSKFKLEPGEEAFGVVMISYHSFNIILNFYITIMCSIS